MQTNVIQLVWHSEYNVVMFNWQSALHQVVNPECLFGSLAFRAVPVSATLITKAHHTAVLAHFFVSAKCNSAAAGNFGV